MGDIESTVDSALQCTEDLRASGGTGKTDVEVASKGAFLTFDWFVFEFTAGDVRGTLVHGIELVLLECSSSQEETGAVGSSIVRPNQVSHRNAAIHERTPRPQCNRLQCARRRSK